MMKRLLIVLFLFVFPWSAHLQAPEAPLTLVTNGDLWTWQDGTLNKITHWGHNWEMALSPDGRHIAYYSYARITVEAIQRTGGIGGGKLPGNIWVIDPVTGEAFRTQDQPEDAAFFSEDAPEKAVIRSTPMWSPDSANLAWTEYIYPDDGSTTLQLVVFDMATQQARVIATGLPPQAGVPGPMDGVWGQTGIILYNSWFNPADKTYGTGVLVYTPDGTRLSQVDYPLVNDRAPLKQLLVTDQGREYMAITYEEAWERVDLLSGEMTPLKTAPEGYSLLAPEASLRLVAASTVDEFSEVLLPDGTPIDLPRGEGWRVYHVALSPDGQALAYKMFNANEGYSPLTIWRDGVFETVPLGADQPLFQMVWGPVVWRIREDAG
jgi:hypothetical protein